MLRKVFIKDATVSYNIQETVENISLKNIQFTPSVLVVPHVFII